MAGDENADVAPGTLRSLGIGRKNIKVKRYAE
jgi:hypothetical protein